jgi:hypothetical protein
MVQELEYYQMDLNLNLFKFLDKEHVKKILHTYGSCLYNIISLELV